MSSAKHVLCGPVSKYIVTVEGEASTYEFWGTQFGPLRVDLPCDLKEKECCASFVSSD